MITDKSEPAAVASPIGSRVSGKRVEVRYTPGMRTSAMATMLCKMRAGIFRRRRNSR